MSNWTELPLEQLAEISSGGTPSRANPSFWNGEIPWVTPSDITSSKSNYIFDTKDAITESGVRSSSAKLLPEGALLLTSRATIGEIKIAARPVTTNQGFKNIVHKSQVDGKFLFYQLSRMKGSFERFAAGSTFLEINRKDTGRVMIPLPVKKEVQSQIAQVLQTIDQTVEKTEALIEKYQQIKAGLMHDLFTRGIGPDGKLRPPREEAPERYQETVVGWIPRDWSLQRLGSIYSETARNGMYKPASFHGRGPKIVNMGDMFSSTFVDIDGIENRVEVTDKEYSLYGLREGDLLFGRRSLVFEGAGKCALISRLADRSTFESSIIRVRLDRKSVDPLFAAFFLSSEIAYKDRRRFIRQVAVSGISGEDLKQFNFPVPSLAEQREVTKRINTIESKIEAETNTVEKLKKQKSGLMTDLLTGKVQVRAEPEVANV